MWILLIAIIVTVELLIICIGFMLGANLLTMSVASSVKMEEKNGAI